MGEDLASLWGAGGGAGIHLSCALLSSDWPPGFPSDLSYGSK